MGSGLQPTTGVDSDSSHGLSDELAALPLQPDASLWCHQISMPASTFPHSVLIDLNRAHGVPHAADFWVAHTVRRLPCLLGDFEGWAGLSSLVINHRERSHVSRWQRKRCGVAGWLGRVGSLFGVFKCR